MNGKIQRSSLFKVPVIWMMLLAITALTVLASCSGTSGTAPSSQTSKDDRNSTAFAEEPQDKKAELINYMILVNKQNQLPADWEDKLEIVTFKNSVGDDVEVEKSTYEAYLKLKKDLEKEGISIDLDSAYRSVSEQQHIVDEFTQQYGADYVKQYVAVPGFSEHHTGLALDLYLIVDGKAVVENEEMMKHRDIWAKIHSALGEHGFILRYMEGQEDITGYAYEPWHIRYIGDPNLAVNMMNTNTVLEKQLGVEEQSRKANAEARQQADEEAKKAAEANAIQEAGEQDVAAITETGNVSQADISVAETTSYEYGNETSEGGDYAYNGGDGLYHAEYNELYNDDGPSQTMPGWHNGYLETYYNASGHYLASTWTVDDEGFYRDENGRYVIGVDISHQEDMPYGTVVETGKGEGVVYDYGSGAEVHDFATIW